MSSDLLKHPIKRNRICDALAALEPVELRLQFMPIATIVADSPTTE